MKTVVYWAIVALFGAVVVNDAYALTLKSGEVLTADGVVHVTESANTKKMVEADGYAIIGSNLVIDAEGTLVDIPLSDLRGKSEEGRIEVVKEAVGEAIFTNIVAEQTEGMFGRETEELNAMLASGDFQSILDAGFSEEVLANVDIDEVAQSAYDVANDIVGKDHEAHWEAQNAFEAGEISFDEFKERTGQ